MPQINWDDVQINLPKTLALLHVGATSYYCFLDPRVRNSHQSLRNRIHHWYTSKKLFKAALTGITLSTVASSLNNWKNTKEQAWLLGGALFLAIIPYHFMFLTDDEKALEADEEKGKIVLDLDKREVLCNHLGSWTCKFTFKLLLGVAATGVFFWVQSKDGSAKEAVKN